MERRLFITSAAAAGAALAVPAFAQEDARTVVDRFAAALSAHDIAAFAALFADDYVNHQASAAAPAPAAGKSEKQATVDFFAARLVAMPDLHVAVEAGVVSSDRAAASFVYSGTHGGTYSASRRPASACVSRRATYSWLEVAGSLSTGAWAISPASWRSCDREKARKTKP